MTDRKVLKSEVLGNPQEFAVEWGLSEAFSKPGKWAIGYFTIHIRGHCLGVKAADATLLACSYDAIQQRLEERGSHQAPFSSRAAAEIVSAVKVVCYLGARPGDRFLHLSEEEFRSFLFQKHIIWAPDGDQAFDDGSHVLQFDIDDQVRLIAFTNMDTLAETVSTISEVTLDADTYYSILQHWIDTITKARADMLKAI
jgi:hypothetical protein